MEAAAAGDDLEAAIDAAIATCDGNARVTIRALIVANDLLLQENASLTAELDHAWRWISPGYTRSTNRRRMNSGDPD